MNMARETGTVKWFNSKKGFGFLQRDSDNKDLFVHFSGITMTGYKTLGEGDRVEFDVATGAKGLQAENVVVTKSGRDIKEEVKKETIEE